MCIRLGGITPGLAITTINITTVATQHSEAHRAFILVPLVCGFFADLINAVVSNILAKLKRCLRSEKFPQWMQTPISLPGI